jgi:thiamine kinase
MSPPAASLRAEVLARLPQLAGAVWRPLAGGRTNHLWRVAGAVVKSYDPDAASPLFPNDPDAERRALAALSASGLAPVPLGGGTTWIAYRYLQGAAWRSGTASVARALHRLHGHPGAGFRPLGSGSAALLAQGRAILAACPATLPEPPDPGLPPAAPCLIHGDAVPGNIIACTQGLTLIDWQCPASGDPAEDLAMFLSPAMQWLYRGAPLTGPERDEFLAAYPDGGTVARFLVLEPLFRWRMAAHCLWKSSRGAPDYSAALRLEIA